MASWDSTIYDSNSLNKVTSSNDRVYAILKVGVRLKHPPGVELVLRKRICLRVYKGMGFGTKLLRVFTGKESRTACGVMYEVVMGIPKQEGMQPPPKIPANPSFVELDEDENAVEKFKKAMSSISNILALDRLKQEVALKEKLALSGKVLRKRYALGESPSLSRADSGLVYAGSRAESPEPDDQSEPGLVMTTLPPDEEEATTVGGAATSLQLNHVGQEGGGVGPEPMVVDVEGPEPVQRLEVIIEGIPALAVIPEEPGQVEDGQPEVSKPPTEEGSQPGVGEEGSQPAPEEGSQPAPEEGSQPVPEEGSQPAPEEGSQPAPEEGSQPAPEEGSQPATEEGSQPAPEEGSQPAPEEGSQPAPEEGSQPATEEGSQPATEEGSQPAPEEGSQPATEEGSQPATEEGSQPVPEQEKLPESSVGQDETSKAPSMDVGSPNEEKESSKVSESLPEPPPSNEVPPMEGPPKEEPVGDTIPLSKVPEVYTTPSEGDTHLETSEDQGSTKQGSGQEDIVSQRRRSEGDAKVPVKHKPPHSPYSRSTTSSPLLNKKPDMTKRSSSPSHVATKRDSSPGRGATRRDLSPGRGPIKREPSPPSSGESESSSVVSESAAAKVTVSLIVGERVVVDVGSYKLGTVKYVGETEFAPGEWVGVALDRPIGKHNGTVKGVKYFKCKDKCGIFVRREKIISTESSISSSKQPRNKSPSPLRKYGSNPAVYRQTIASSAKFTNRRSSLGVGKKT